MESGEIQDDGRHNGNRIKPYVYRDSETGETHVSPFVATVSGIGGEFFGTGTVIGQIKGNPAIQIQDCNDQQFYVVMGYESWWTPGTIAEVLDKVRTGEMHFDSVADYRRSLDERSRIARAEDDAFLLQNGIDPNL